MSNPIQNPIAGPTRTTSLPDGSSARLRADRQASSVVQHGHGEYYEEAARGGVWTISTAVAGVSPVTSVGVIVTASANPIVGVYNRSSNINCHITRAVLTVCTGTAVTGGFVWGMLTSPTGITSNGVTAINNRTFVKGGHQAVAFDGSAALVGATLAPTLLRQFGAPFPGAMSAGQAASIAEQENDIVIGPGCYLGLYSALICTGLNVVASISWAEIPT